MTDASQRCDEIDVLLDRVLDGLHSEEDVRRLNEILRTDTEAWRRFVSYMGLHGRLVWGEGLSAEGRSGQLLKSGGATDGGEADDSRTAKANERFGMMNDGLPAGAAPIGVVSSAGQTSLIPPSSSLLQGLLSNTLFSYTIATLILATMVVAGWAWKAPSGRTSSAAAWRWVPAADELLPEIVGKITRADGCRWFDSNTAAFEGQAVAVGRRFDLIQGSLEITYNTGTRIALEGPATFRVTMYNGGFLALGKLTARIGDASGVEAVAAKAKTPSDKHNALFGVYTPKAVVTDNDSPGARFSVAVDGSGAALTRAFQGKIVFHAPQCPRYVLVKDYCGMSGMGPNHDGICIFVNGKEPYEFAIKTPQQPPLCALAPGSDGLKFCPCVGE